MSKRFTYKELSILIGILVAVIILLIIWMQPETAEGAEAGSQVIPQWVKPSAKIISQLVASFKSF